MTTRTKVVGGAVLIALAFLLFNLWFFQPQKLFINETVNETPPMPTASVAQNPIEQVGPVTLFTGDFVSYEHETTGTASLLRLGDGTQAVRLTDFKTSNGPDVHVWLSRASASAGDDATSRDHVDLGPLKGNIGNQNYSVPASAAGQKWDSVYIWCERFTVAFGAAPLDPAPLTPR